MATGEALVSFGTLTKKNAIGGPRIVRQVDLTVPLALSGFASGLLDRQAKSMCSLAGFLKVLAACLERNAFDGPLRWSRKCN